MPVDDKIETSARMPAPAEDEPSLVGLEKALARFTQSFQSSARRWELLVYPAIFIFFMLSITGFYLIYSITDNMHKLAVYVDPQMATNMDRITSHMVILSRNIEAMSEDVGQISGLFGEMDQYVDNIGSLSGDISDHMNTMEPFVANMVDMNLAARILSANTQTMGLHMNRLNYNVGRPLSFMNTLSPW